MKKLQGIYLVIDPAMEREALLPKLREALAAGIDLLQVWNRWPEGISVGQKQKLIREILNLAEPHRVPVLINEDWQLLAETGLHGVHFDHIPDKWEEVKKSIPADAIIGLTAGNDRERIAWADAQKIDYISFCAMFPSASAGDCEIVTPQSVLEARKITKLPLFLSGGIRPDNLEKLAHLDFQGVAIISGIMSAGAPAKKISAYRKELKRLKKTRS